MIAKVAIIAPGAMGSAVGRHLSEHGARVLRQGAASLPSAGPKWRA
jgi:hypothetical protein